MRTKQSLLIMIVIGLLLFASCGGGSTVAPDPGDNNLPADNEPVSFDQWSQDTEIPEASKSYRGIPAIPQDGERAASDADDNRTVLGKDAIDFSQCLIDGDAMIINADDAADTNPNDIPAWAMYKIAGLSDMDPLSLNVECMPDGYGEEYSVAVADYTVLDWQWFGPTGLPEVQIDLTTDDHTYITNLGNLYFLVVCYGTNSATHYQSTVVAQPAASQTLPGAPAGLVASKGEIESGVGLRWIAGAGAGYYEIYRQGAMWRFDDSNPPPPDFEPGYDPENDEWIRIGETEETQYLDSEVIPGVVYMYKVRSVNAVGVSRFSEIDEGWVFDDWEPPFDGIHGYVFGNERVFWDDDNPPPGDFAPPEGDPGSDPCPGPCPGIMPLADATVTLANMLEGAGQGYMYTATTDCEGFYQFDQDIRPGEYMLFAELEGWRFFEQYEVCVRENMSPMEFDFFGWPASVPPPWEPPKGVHGYVWGDTMIDGDPVFGPGDDPERDPEGGDDGSPGFLPYIIPLEGALVRVIDPESREIIARTEADAEGFYQFEELPAGFYQLACELEGWVIDPESHWFDIPEGIMPSIEFDFWGYPESNIPPTPPLPEGLSGYVWDATGRSPNDGEPGDPLPMEGVEISVLDIETGEVRESVLTDATGFYHIPTIEAGWYEAQAAFDGYWFDPPSHPLPYQEGVFPVQLDFIGFEGIEPRPGPWPPVEREGISGVVWGMEVFDPAGAPGMMPLAGVLINVLDLETGDFVASMATGEDGVFYFPLSDLGGGGTFAVTAEMEGWMFEPEEHRVFLTGALMYAELEFMGFRIGDGQRPPGGFR